MQGQLDLTEPTLLNGDDISHLVPFVCLTWLHVSLTAYTLATDIHSHPLFESAIVHFSPEDGLSLHVFQICDARVSFEAHRQQEHETHPEKGTAQSP